MRKLRVEALESRDLLSGDTSDATTIWLNDTSTESVVAAQSNARDAALWPFAADSPWNTSLGSGANYATITSPGFNSNGSASLNVTHWSHPVYTASPTDPVKDFYDESALVWPGWRYTSVTKIASIRVPDGVMPDQQSDGHLHLIDPQQNIAVEMWQAHLRSDGSWGATVAVVTDLTGWGTGYDDYHGVRSSGMSALGGLIRKQELQNASIPHALAIAVDPQAMNFYAPGGHSWVWPASWSDNPSQNNGYGTSGNLYMGSLLAIAPSVDIDALGLSPQGLAIARALQDYGAYVTEQGSGDVIYYAEPASAGILETSAGELARLTPYLQAVTNNTPDNIGGGGTRRADPAPPLGQTDPQPASYLVSGTVTLDGQPVDQAMTALFSADGTWLRTVSTGPDGQYSFTDVEPDSYYVVLLGVGDVWFRQGPTFTIGDADYYYDFAIEQPPVAIQTFSIVGTAMTSSAAPIVGATIALVDANGQTIATTTTDVNGQFHFGEVEAGSYVLSASADGYLKPHEKSLAGTDGLQIAQFVFRTTDWDPSLRRHWWHSR